MKEKQSKIPSILGLVGDAGWYGLVPVVQKTIGLFLVPIYTFYLSPTDYGVIALVALIVGIPKLLSDWGVTWSIQRDYLNYEGDEAKEYLFTALLVNVVSSVIAYGSLFLLGQWFVPLIAPEWEVQYAFYLNLSLMAAMLQGVTLTTMTYLIIERRPQIYSLFQLGVYILSSILQLYLLIGLRMGLMAVFLTQLLAAVIGAIVGLRILWPHLKPRFYLDAAHEIAKFGWQTVPSNVINYVLNRGDQWVIQSVLSLSELGLYSFGMKFFEVMNIYSGSVKTAWRPVYFRQIKEGVSSAEILRHGNVLIEISTLVFLAGMLFVKEVIFVFAAPAYHATYVVAMVLMGKAFLTVPGTVQSSSMVYEKKVYLALIPQLMVGAASIGLAILAAPGWGIEGVALSRLMGLVLQMSIGIFVAVRYTQVGHLADWKRWLTLMGLMVGAVLAALAFEGQGFWTLAAFKALLWLGVAAIVFWLERSAVMQRVRQLAEGRFAEMLVGE